VLRKYGGLRGVRDVGAIESALARPYCGYPIEKKAAALVHSLTLNHGFIDGNKRTAVFMLAELLLNSGYTLRFESTELLNDEVEDMVLAVTEHRMWSGQPMRKIIRSVHEASREIARRFRQTPEYLQSRRDRKKIEMLFAHLKRILKLDRLRLRGPTGAHD